MCGVRGGLALALVVMAACAQATSAGYHGPVELSVRGGEPCLYVRLGSPREDARGWSVVLQEAPEGAVLWRRDVPRERGLKAPTSVASCLPISGVVWRVARPYRVELGTYQSYRSDFCWRPAPATGGAPKLLHVDEKTGRCTDLPWVGGDGDALTSRGTWHRLVLWWRGLFDH